MMKISLLTLLFMVSIAIAISGHSYLAKIMDGSKLAVFLGNLSMSVYLVHTPVIRWIRSACDMGAWTYIDLLPLFAAVLFAAVGHYYLTAWLIKWIPNLWKSFMNKITV